MPIFATEVFHSSLGGTLTLSVQATGVIAPFLGEVSIARLALLGVVSGVFWVPLWLFGNQMRILASARQTADIRRRRYETYLRIEIATREINSELPITRYLVLNDDVMSRAKAKSLYSARPGSGKAWEDKVAITELLERLDRLAIGAGMGVIDIEVWQRMAGHRVVNICRLVRTFVEVSRDGRANRYYALGQIDRIFQRMMNEESVQNAATDDLRLVRSDR